MYELPVSDAFRFITDESGVWRINQVRKVLLRMPISELKKLYQMLDAESEVKEFALQHASKFVHWELTHPNCVIMISPIYRAVKKAMELVS